MTSVVHRLEMDRMPGLLNSADLVVNNSIGALYEGDIFSVLKSSLFVIRFFKLFEADSAIDCLNKYSSTMSFANCL